MPTELDINRYVDTTLSFPEFRGANFEQRSYLAAIFKIPGGKKKNYIFAYS